MFNTTKGNAMITEIRNSVFEAMGMDLRTLQEKKNDFNKKIKEDMIETLMTIKPGSAKVELPKSMAKRTALMVNKTVEQFMKKFRKINPDTIVLVQMIKFSEGKGSAQYKGFTVGMNNTHYIWINETKMMSELKFTLDHELWHVADKLTGDLTQDANGLFWKGESCSDLPYDLLPFEHSANLKAHKSMTDWMNKETKGKVKIDFMVYLKANGEYNHMLKEELKMFETKGAKHYRGYAQSLLEAAK